MPKQPVSEPHHLEPDYTAAGGILSRVLWSRLDPSIRTARGVPDGACMAASQCCSSTGNNRSDPQGWVQPSSVHAMLGGAAAVLEAVPAAAGAVSFQLGSAVFSAVASIPVHLGRLAWGAG
jgi:hypothetical protein